jgi:hypothetical protein
MGELIVTIPDHFKPALAILLNSFNYSRSTNADRWQLAVEVRELISYGATLTDIRWLLLRGFAEHAKETTVPSDSSRSFRSLLSTHVPPDACLVLTADGVAFIRRLLDQSNSVSHNPKEYAPPGQRTLADGTTPHWDKGRRELHYQNHIVKQYRVSAQNQELVLTTFQELGWPTFIDDPLPPIGESDPKQRLQATIKSLNRNQLQPLVKFHGNGSGRQIYWQTVSCHKLVV